MLLKLGRGNIVSAYKVSFRCIQNLNRKYFILENGLTPLFRQIFKNDILWVPDVFFFK